MGKTMFKEYISIPEKNKTGFTLIELIVVIAIFMFVLGAALSIFLSIVKNQKKVLAEVEVLNQLSYVQEYMSKALRMAKAAGSTGDNSEITCMNNHEGYIYLLTRRDADSNLYRGIKFINQSGPDSSDVPICQEFFIDNLVTGDTSTPLVLKELKNIISTTTDSDAVPLTATNLVLDPTIPVKFSINGGNGSITDCAGKEDSCGATENDLAQPRVTVLLTVKVAGDSESPTRTVQTTVSQRNLNVK